MVKTPSAIHEPGMGRACGQQGASLRRQQLSCGMLRSLRLRFSSFGSKVCQDVSAKFRMDPFEKHGTNFVREKKYAKK